MAELVLNVHDTTGAVLNVVDGTSIVHRVLRGPVEVTGGGGGSPTGGAGGFLSGSYPNPGVNQSALATAVDALIEAGDGIVKVFDPGPGEDPPSLTISAPARVVASPTAPSDTSKLWLRTADGLEVFQDFRLLDDGPVPAETNGSGADDPATISDFYDFVPEVFQPAVVVNGRYCADPDVSPQAAGIFTDIANRSGAFRATVGLGDWINPTGNPDGTNSVNIVITDNSSSGPFAHCYADYSIGEGIHCNIALGYDLLGEVTIVDEFVVDLLGAGDRFGLGYDGFDTWTGYVNGVAVGTLSVPYPGVVADLTSLTMPTGSSGGVWGATTEWFAVMDGDVDFDPQSLTLFEHDGSEWVKRIEPNHPRPYLPERITRVTPGVLDTVAVVTGESGAEGPGLFILDDADFELPSAADHVGKLLAVQTTGADSTLAPAAGEFVQNAYDGSATTSWVWPSGVFALWRAASAAEVGGPAAGWLALSLSAEQTGPAPVSEWTELARFTTASTNDWPTFSSVPTRDRYRLRWYRSPTAAPAGSGGLTRNLLLTFDGDTTSGNYFNAATSATAISIPALPQGGGGRGEIELIRTRFTTTIYGLVGESNAAQAPSNGLATRVASAHSYRLADGGVPALATWALAASNSDVWAAGWTFILEGADLP